MDVKGYYYAGLRQVLVPGLSVAEAVERLHRLAYVERRMIRLLASRIVSIPQRSLKVLLARLQYEDALHTDGLRSRISEMRTNKSKLEDTPDSTLQILFDEAEHLPGTYPFLAAVTHGLTPAPCAPYQNSHKSTHHLTDHPTPPRDRHLPP